MDKEKIILTLIMVLLVVFPFFTGFFSGRKWERTFHKCNDVVSTDTVIEYVTAKDTVYIERSNVSYITTHDTVVRYVELTPQKADSVLTDYYRTKRFTADFSTDTTGTFTVTTDVSENKVLKQTATILPTVKTVTVTNTVEEKCKFLRPYIMAGTNLKLNSQKLECGVLLKNRYIISIAGLHSNNDNGYTMNAGYVFR